MGDQAGFDISQPIIAGRHPETGEVAEWLVENGFASVPADRIANDYIAATTWWHPEAGILVADTKPKNFVLDRSGDIYPIDLITQAVPPGSDLDRVLRWDF